MFLRPLLILNIPDDTFLRVPRPPYGIHEAGTRWNYKYHLYYKQELNLESVLHDLRFMFTLRGMSADSSTSQVTWKLTCLQTDDTEALETQKSWIHQIRNLYVRCFNGKPPTMIKDDDKITFDGADVCLHNGTEHTIRPNQTTCQRCLQYLRARLAKRHMFHSAHVVFKSRQATVPTSHLVSFTALR